MSIVDTEEAVDEVKEVLEKTFDPVGDPVEGMQNTLIIIVGTIAASFISFGYTLILTVIFSFVFIYHFLRFGKREFIG